MTGRGPRWTPNHPKTIRKPPARERAKVVEVVDERFETIWGAYPKDWQRGKAACLATIAEAVKEGVDPDDLLLAARAYATESEGFTRSKVCFSDNWFAGGRWQRFLDALAEEQQAQTALAADHHARLAAWVRRGWRHEGRVSAGCIAHRVPCAALSAPRITSRVSRAAPSVSRIASFARRFLLRAA